MVTLDSTQSPDAAAGRMIKSAEIHSQNLAYAWIITATFGALGISMLRGVESGFVRLGAPCGAMLLYLMYGWNQQAKNTEKLADSLYFLGFIWTLYALIDRLLVATTVMTTEQLFSVFGYALVTTGLGMFLRMALIQLQYDVPDQLVDGREQIARDVIDFSKEVAASTAAVAQFRAESLTHAERWMRECGESAERVQRQWHESSTATVVQIRTAVETVSCEITASGAAAKQAAEALDQASRATRELAKRVSANADKWGAAVETGIGRAAAGLSGFAAKIDHVDLPPDLMSQKLDAAVAALRASALVIERSSSQWAGTLDAGVQGVARAVAALATRVDGVAVPPDVLSRKVSEATAGIHSAVTELGSAVAALQAEQDKLRASITGSTQSVAAFSRQVVELGGHLARWSAEAEKTIERSAAGAAQGRRLRRRWWWPL